MLDIPIASRVTKIELLADHNTLMVDRKLGKGNRERIEITLPAILAIEDNFSVPRYASLPSLFRSLRKKIMRYDLRKLGLAYKEARLNKPKTKTINISVPKPRPKRIFTPDSNLSAAERMRLIMSGGVAEREEELFEGSPKDLSLKFVTFLKRVTVVK